MTDNTVCDNPQCCTPQDGARRNPGGPVLPPMPMYVEITAAEAAEMQANLNAKEARRRLGYHPVRSDNQRVIYEHNRELYMALYEYVASVGNPSREQSLALTALQESLMWLNAHVACNDIEE